MVLFYDNERSNLHSSHNRPLYIFTMSVNGVELKRAMLNLGSSLNITSLWIVDAVDEPLDRRTRQPIEESSF